MKNNSISKILVSVKTNGSRKAMALLLGFATLAMAVGGMSSSARADDGSPAQGSWLTAVKRINQTGTRLHRCCFLDGRRRLAGDGFG